jgi:endonuclease III
VPDRTRRAAAIGHQLAGRYPDARVELDHGNAFELLVATILSAQSTDKLINTVTPTLFARWPDARALAAADPAELEQVIHATGFFRMKAKHLLGMSRTLVEKHDGEVPRTMKELVELPGVARKTANVLLNTIWKLAEGVVVDTHVPRLAQRLGLSAAADPAKIEEDLMAILPRDQWGSFADRLIWHGRRVCFARQPACEQCELSPLCPSTLAPGGRA